MTFRLPSSSPAVSTSTQSRLYKNGKGHCRHDDRLPQMHAPEADSEVEGTSNDGVASRKQGCRMGTGGQEASSGSTCMPIISV